VKPFTWVTPSRRARRVLHTFSGASADARRLAVAPDLGRQDAAVAEVDRIAYGLANEVGAERLAGEPVALETLTKSPDVALFGERFVDLEVVAPAGELEPVEAPGRRLGDERLERQVSPLPREESDRPRRGRNGLMISHGIFPPRGLTGQNRS
jgi:hypothetical protein